MFLIFLNLPTAIIANIMGIHIFYTLDEKKCNQKTHKCANYFLKKSDGLEKGNKINSGLRRRWRRTSSSVNNLHFCVHSSRIFRMFCIRSSRRYSIRHNSLSWYRITQSDCNVFFGNETDKNSSKKTLYCCYFDSGIGCIQCNWRFMWNSNWKFKYESDSKRHYDCRVDELFIGNIHLYFVLWGQIISEKGMKISMKLFKTTVTVLVKTVLSVAFFSWRRPTLRVCHNKTNCLT